MTCIAAIRTPKGTILGADSAVDMGTHTALVDDKLFLCAGMWCGGAGDALAVQAVRYSMPTIPKRANPLTWAAKEMTPRLLALRSNLVDIDETVYAEFLFAHPRALFLVTLRGEVLPCTRGFAAIGSGAEYAMATIYNMTGATPEAQINQAILTAHAFVPGSVQPPVRTQWVK